jgi:hypothetical protein
MSTGFYRAVSAVLVTLGILIGTASAIAAGSGVPVLSVLEGGAISQAAGSSRLSPASLSSDACNFSNARTSICRIRSRLTP